MYWADHFPAHFHAQYGEFEAYISIDEIAVIKGELPSRQLKLVLAWAEIHKDELMRNWASAKEHGKIAKIEPLR